MRVFIASTPDELELHQAAACEVVSDLGFEPLLRDPAVRRGVGPVTACARQVAAADAMVAIVGWRRGSTPPVELGGDGLRPWSYWELQSAFEHQKPVVGLLAAESWQAELREDNARARAVMQDLRGEIQRLSTVFEEEAPERDGSRPLNRFRALLRRRLLEVERTDFTSTMSGGARLRSGPFPELPAEPYPVLLPYTHPDLMAGRERELRELESVLRSPVPIIGLYAPSGAGKSSFLLGGLIPRLRAAGRAVAVDRHAAEPGISRRLLGDLLETDGESLADIVDHDGEAFVDHLLLARRLAGRVPPVLVVDQFEDLLKTSAPRRARAAAGILLAASVQRQPGLSEPPYRFILAYRQDAHGEVCRWLADVLGDARRAGMAEAEYLPHDLSIAGRFRAFALSPLGTARSGTEDRLAAATRIFQAAIEKPLRIADGRHYPWHFADGDARRLARAFAEARLTRPEAPLTPELQVVLAHLLSHARHRGTDLIEVPSEPGELIDQALEEHLIRALDAAFPQGRTREARLGRTRAILVLRELADAEGEGQRDQGLPILTLARAIDPQAEDQQVLERLAAPQTRLVVLEQRDGEWVYRLAHDRLAELLVRLVDHEERFVGLGVDADLLDLRRFVTLQAELFESGEVEQATAIASGKFARVAENAAALLWSPAHERWWDACRERRRREKWRRPARYAVALLAVILVALTAWVWETLRGRRQALLEQVATGDAEAAFAALDRLLADTADVDAGEIRRQWRRRREPMDVFERGLGGVEPERLATAVLGVAEFALPFFEDVPDDPIWISSVAWALDYAAIHKEVSPRRANAPAPRFRSTRDRLLAPLRRLRPPPPVDELDWVDIPAGTFWMGADPGEVGEEADWARPRRRVTVSAFRIQRHELTNAEYRLFKPEHERDDDEPAKPVSWEDAYTYAAWIGGRLPTEAEWEYAARAGCAFTFCRRDGTAAEIGEVAWWAGNAVDLAEGRAPTRPVGRLEPNPWGLYDMLGNAWEMTADWSRPYEDGSATDPIGPTHGSSRGCRGGYVRSTAAELRPYVRGVTALRRLFSRISFRMVREAMPEITREVGSPDGAETEEGVARIRPQLEGGPAAYGRGAGDGAAGR